MSPGCNVGLRRRPQVMRDLEAQLRVQGLGFRVENTWTKRVPPSSCEQQVDMRTIHAAWTEFLHGGGDGRDIPMRANCLCLNPLNP